MGDKTILVVEDEKPLERAIQVKLERDGFSVVSARNATQAWNYFSDGVDIDVVWLDHYLLGQETGLDLLAKIKSDDALKTIPVFVVSNTATAEKKRAYLQFGITRYFTKANYRLDDIIADINKVLTDGEAE